MPFFLRNRGQISSAEPMPLCIVATHRFFTGRQRWGWYTGDCRRAALPGLPACRQARTPDFLLLIRIFSQETRGAGGGGIGSGGGASGSEGRGSGSGSGGIASGGTASGGIASGGAGGGGLDGKCPGG